MVKDHSDNERGNPLPPHGLVFPISPDDVMNLANGLLCSDWGRLPDYHCHV